MIKRVLFIDGDKEIRDVVSDHCSLVEMKNFDVLIAANFAQAKEFFQREKIDGIIIDALGPKLQNVLNFIKEIRILNPNASIIALVAFLDMILDIQMKESLKLEKVSVVDKLKALKIENVKSLFESSCTNGYGEEL